MGAYTPMSIERADCLSSERKDNQGEPTLWRLPHSQKQSAATRQGFVCGELALSGVKHRVVTYIYRRESVRLSLMLAYRSAGVYRAEYRIDVTRQPNN